jgi:ubiquinol-cytochrome c reductase cytochrome c1 subunit
MLLLLRASKYLVGLAFAGVLLLSFFVGVSTYFSSPPAATAEEEFHLHPKHLSLSSDGPFGKFDKQQLQRGYQVYKEVCAACHSMSLVAYHDLEGLGYNEAEIKAEAAQHEVPAVNPETGEPSTRKALPSDHFPSPYANETAARGANNNALPPDLSLMTKARHGGAAYVYSILTGYKNQQGYKNEKGEVLLEKFPTAKTPEGLHFNPYFANLNLAMPPPLTQDGQVTYAPGNPKPTVDQMAKDVSAFLVWTAEPKLERRHATGIAVAIFLLFATIFTYLAYQNIWREQKAKVRVTGALEPENQAKTRRAKGKAGIVG